MEEITILTIDRKEGKFFVCYDENEIRKDIPENEIENGSPGDVIVLKDGKYTVDKNLTEKKREEINNLQDSLWE